MTTIRKVAERAGVSPTTVSHVINKTRFVSEGTKQRVLEAMREMSYRPNILARSLRRGETHTVGLILPDSANPFFAEISRSIEESAFRLGYNLILCNTEGDLEKEHLYVDVLSKKQVDGIIFVDAGDKAGSIEALVDQLMPVVVVDCDLPDVNVDAVLTDNLQGGYAATRHLLVLGHRRIGCIAGPPRSTPSTQRLLGYRKALTEAGLTVDESYVVCGDFHPALGRTAALKLLALPDPPTAVFACNDLTAIGALCAAAEAGLHVPADLAVVGYDDIELASYSVPPLTTIAQPKVDIGQAAVNLLLERIAYKTRPARRVLLPTSLIIRQSCGGSS